MKYVLLLALLASPANPRQSWLGEVRALHADVDAKLAHGDASGAREALRRFLAMPPPAGLRAEEAREVMQDAWFRAASVDLQLGKSGDARADADSGLALGSAHDLFTANLLVIRGRARELLKDDRGAVSDYQEALRINEALLHAETEKSP